MPKDGTATRNKILDTALDLILDQGFGSTSIDNVISKVGITKGAFFYHFKSKREMAIALINRFAEHDKVEFTEHQERAAKLASDPLQQLLVFIGLFEETFDQLKDPYPGCLFAVYCYQGDMFDDEVKEIIRSSLLLWREYISNKLKEIMQTHESQLEIDIESLADMMTTVFEGAFIMTKIFNDPGLIAKHLRHYRNYIELLFRDKTANPTT